MEDAHTIVLNLDAATGTSFFGVYDGHEGPAVSKYCARHLHVELRRHESFRDNLQTAIDATFLRMDEMMKDRKAGKELSGYDCNNSWKAYKKAKRMSPFVHFCQKPAYPGPENDGCTACVVLIRGNQIVVGNAGDSRCLLARNDQVLLEKLKHQALIATFVNIIRNTVTLLLDGNNHDVWAQYEMVMAHIRFWFVSNGVSLNLRPALGDDKYVHIVPHEGTMHLVLRYGRYSVNLIIDSREAWLYGAAGAKALAQFSRSTGTQYIQHEYCIELKGGGTYSQVAAEGIGQIPIGLEALRAMCSVLGEFDENTDHGEIEKQLGIAIIHFLEPLKFHKAHHIVSKAILSGSATTLDDEDPSMQHLLKIWGRSSTELSRYVFRRLCNTKPFPLSFKKLTVGGLNSIDDILDNIFIMPHSFVPAMLLKKKRDAIPS